MITVVGLGPGHLDRVAKPVRDLLLDGSKTVIVRTLAHPAATDLASIREVVSCDDLYEAATYPDIYQAIVDRVVEHAVAGHVIYAVPGSPMVGEFAVRDLLASGHRVEVVPGESFIDAVLAHVGYDPLDRGLQLLNGHQLPDPLILDKPTIIAHLDRPEVLADVSAAVDRVVPEGVVVTILVAAGSEESVVVETEPGAVDPDLAGNLTSMFIDSEPGGLIGAIRAMRLLREECPWDREQTHQTLVKNLIEETYEFIEAVRLLPEAEVDWVAYARVEEELGDILLLVLFNEVIARGVGAFDIDSVAEVLRQKLVRRHPHVFGDVVVDSASEVKANWDRIKQEEKEGDGAESALDGVPSEMPGLYRASKLGNRAAKVGFDWDNAGQVVEKVTEELGEVRAAMDGDGVVDDEIGDLLFTVVNLARHLGVDPEMALQRTNDRVIERFRRMEAEGPLEGLDLEALNERWERAK